MPPANRQEFEARVLEYAEIGKERMRQAAYRKSRREKYFSLDTPRVVDPTWAERQLRIARKYAPTPKDGVKE